MEPNRKTAADTAAEEQRRMERVCAAYRDIFGADEKTRTAAQQIVWADLQIVGYAKSQLFVPDSKTGALCPMRAAFADGRRSVLLYVATNIEAANRQQQQP